MLPSRRRDALALLYEARRDFRVCRAVESMAHAASRVVGEYLDSITRSAYNLQQNPCVHEEVVYANDEYLIRGTVVERIEKETQLRAEFFENMLKEKYDALDDSKFAAMIKCRRCGSAEISWEEKQTKSADEGSSVFCICMSCKARWVMR